MENTTCLICSKVFSTPGNMRKHIREVHGEGFNLDWICSCGRVFGGSQALNGHYRFCLTHRNGKAPLPPGTKGKPSKFRGMRLEEIVSDPEETRKKLREAFLRNPPTGKASGPEKELLRKKKISDSLVKYREQNPLGSGGKCSWYLVNGSQVQGTWERDLACKMLELGILWEKNIPQGNRSWFYVDYEQVRHRYTPDFFLPEENLQLELKGYWWGSDKQKMKWVYSQNPESRISLILEKQFKELCLVENKDQFMTILQECLNPIIE